MKEKLGGALYDTLPFSLAKLELYHEAVDICGVL